MHGTEHHLEEAEHAKHALHDPFTTRVAMSMAIVAAILAVVTLLSHRAHNGTLANLSKSTQNKTEASDNWSYYQAKKIRQYMLEAQTEWNAIIAEDLSGTKQVKAKNTLKDWEEKTKKWEKEGKEIQKKALAFEAEREKYKEKSEAIHHQADFFDLGELGVELALVLCSIAVLTRQKGFWYSGILICALGLGVALYGYVAPAHSSHATDHSNETQEHKNEGAPGSGKKHKSDKEHKSSEQKPAQSH